MNHTASELIPGWYSNGVNREVAPDEIAMRRIAINEMTKLTNVSFWLSCLRVFLNKSSFGSSDYSSVVEYAKKGDENFSLQSENLVKLLCGCAIADKMETEESFLADFLSLAIQTVTVFPPTNLAIPDIPNRAITTYIDFSESYRQMNTAFFLGNPLKNVVKCDIPELTTDNSTNKPHSDSVVKHISALQKDLATTNADLNAVHKSLDYIKSNFISLSEETNILWWLFGAYSTIVKKPFRLISPALLSIIVPIELSKLTQQLPGISGVESIIHRALSNTEFESGSLHSIDSIVNAIATHEDLINKSIPNIKSELYHFVPMLYAVKCRSEYAGNEWKAIYNRTIDLDLESKFSFEFFSQQVYLELMLVNVYNEITT